MTVQEKYNRMEYEELLIDSTKIHYINRPRYKELHSIKYGVNNCYVFEKLNITKAFVTARKSELLKWEDTSDILKDIIEEAEIKDESLYDMEDSVVVLYNLVDHKIESYTRLDTSDTYDIGLNAGTINLDFKHFCRLIGVNKRNRKKDVEDGESK